MNCLELLDKIVINKSVVEKFNLNYYTGTVFREWLDKTIPELKECIGCEQNNPWHKYDVINHLLESVQAINNQFGSYDDKTKRLLAYTMLFHDIGKPMTKLQRVKNGQVIDSFFNHNKKSAEIARKRLPSLGFSGDEVKIIEKLVYKHDIFMFITENKTANPYHRQLTPQLIEDEIKDLSTVGDGVKLMEYLIKIGRSDSLAQNEKMTGPAISLLNKFEKMFNENFNKVEIK